MGGWVGGAHVSLVAQSKGASVSVLHATSFQSELALGFFTIFRKVLLCIRTLFERLEHRGKIDLRICETMHGVIIMT